MMARHFPERPVDFPVEEMRGDGRLAQPRRFHRVRATAGGRLLLALLLSPLLAPAARAGMDTGTVGPGVVAMDGQTTDVAPGQRGDTLHCRISQSRTGAGVQLTASIASTLDAAGTAHFSIRKSGRAGSSTIAQGKDFKVRAGQEATVGQATISLEPGARLTAELAISSQAGTQCHTELSLEH